MKIAVYTIAKNEEKFAKRWADSCAEADYRIVLDTGSTDKTAEILHCCGVTVVQEIIDPWRFDTARNISLHHVPEDADWCIVLDMDEVLAPGWRKALEDHVVNNEMAGVTRIRPWYVWSWKDGKPDREFAGERIHSRNDYNKQTADSLPYFRDE